MKRFFVGFMTLVVVAAMVAPVGAESPWPMFRHDLKHTGRTIYTGPATPTLFWTFQANDAITSSPSIGHNGTIYVGAGGYYNGGGDSSLYAINPDGSLKWQFKTDSGAAMGQAAGVFSSPAIADDGTIYVGSLDNHFYAIEDSVTYGKMKWRTQLLDWPIYSSPSLYDGNIYFGSLNFRFYSLDSDGNIRWWYPTGWCVFSSPVIREDGLIIVGSKDHNLWAFRDSIPYGSIAWTYPTGTFYDGHLIDGSPAIGEDGTIYFGTDPYGAAEQTPVHVDTVFWAVNPDGTLKWKFVMGDGVESSPAIGPDNMVYVGSYDSCVYAIEDLGTEGFMKWKFKTGGPVDASPTVDADGTIYIGSRDGNMYALNPDGSVKWTYPTGGGIESSVTIDGNGYLYFGSFDGKLYALGTGAPDMGAVDVTIEDSLAVGTDYYPTVVLHNYRATDQNLAVTLVIEDAGVPVFSETKPVSGATGSGTSLAIFGPWTVPATVGVTYDFTAYTVLAEDNNPGNDSTQVSALAVAEVDFFCGDINNDGNSLIDIGDLVYLVDYMFTGGPPPPVFDAANLDGAGSIDISDLVYLVDYMFTGGPEPICP